MAVCELAHDMSAEYHVYLRMVVFVRRCVKPG